MKSSTLLDFALFQLTPTRTRCDLVLVHGGKSEKLASGLLEPFVLHLNFVKEEISRGSYSIELRPTSRTRATWFTKATFERFVHFVDCPGVLERFVLLEREILQIATSAQASSELIDRDSTVKPEGVADTNVWQSNESPKIKGEVAIQHDPVPTENCRTQLRRVMEARKRMLCREQAMAYERALAAEFDMEQIADLISFCDTFGAPRLRKACTNFRDLAGKKCGDGLWIEELAAVEACPAAHMPTIRTVGFSNGDLATNGSFDASKSSSSVDNNRESTMASPERTPPAATKFQVPNPMPSHIPYYTYQFPYPMQQLPAYPGYPVPLMQPIPDHYPKKAVWTLSMKHYSPARNEKSANEKDLECEEGSTQTDSTEGESGSDSHEKQEKKSPSTDAVRKKKQKKRSIEAVVIRNINYVTATRRNGERGEDHSDPAEGESNGMRDMFRREEEVHSEVDKLQTTGVSDDHYTIRNLEDVTSSMNLSGADLGLAKAVKQKLTADDSFILTRSISGLEDRNGGGGFEDDGKVSSIMKRNSNVKEDLVISQRLEGSEHKLQSGIRSPGTESSILKPRKEDWLIISRLGDLRTEHAAGEDVIFHENGALQHQDQYTKAGKRSNGVLVDDSFILEGRTAVDDRCYNQWKMDISSVVDMALSKKLENEAKQGSQVVNASEPSDLCVLLERESGYASVNQSWDSNHGFDIQLMESDKRVLSVESRHDDLGDQKITSNCGSLGAKKPGTHGRIGLAKEGRSKNLDGPRKSRTDMLASSKKPALPSRSHSQKSKLEKEEEARQKMEELVIKRQKRIAERTAAAGLASAATKKATSERKIAKDSIKFDNNRASNNNAIKTRAA